MNQQHSVQVCRLKIQGLQTEDANLMAEVGFWLRFTYLVCAVLAGIGTAMASPIVLWILVPIAAGGALSPVHPVDFFYNHVIRRFTGTQPLPKRGMPTRFACGLGTVWLIGTAFAFQAGAATLGYVLGGSMFLIALLVSSTDICIPSIIYRLATGRADLVKRLMG